MSGRGGRVPGAPGDATSVRAFEAVIEEGARGGALVEVPFDPGEVFGSRRARVRATFDGHPYRGSVAFMGGRAVVGVTRAVRDAIGKDVGDAVQVTLARDDAPRTVDVPTGLEAALREAGLLERFQELAYTHRKEFATWVTEAKREETRRRRIREAVEMIAEGSTRP